MTPLRKLTKSPWVRAAVVLVLHVAFFEAVCRRSVHWTESRGEVATMQSFVLSVTALAWALWPLRARLAGAARRALAGAALLAGVVVGLWALDYAYYWHIRPNAGLYEEPAWVAQHPGFQRTLRERVAGNMWYNGRGAGGLTEELDGSEQGKK